MRFRTALILIVVLVGGIFGFQPLMMWIVERTIAQGQQLSNLQNTLFMSSLICRQLWWMLVPAIVVFFLLIAAITSVVRHFRKKYKSQVNASTATAQ